MDSTTYQPPLRAAVLKLVTAKQTPLTAVAVAACAMVPEVRARAYLSILVGSEVLRAAALGAEPGKHWKEWSGRTIRSRPRAGCQPSTVTMDGMRRPLKANVFRLMAERGWSRYRLAAEAGINDAYLYRLEKRCVPPPFPVVAMIAKALGVTMETLITEC